MQEEVEPGARRRRDHRPDRRLEPFAAASDPGDEGHRRVGERRVENEQRHPADALARARMRRVGRPFEGRRAVARDVDRLRRDDRDGDRRRQPRPRAGKPLAPFGREEERHAERRDEMKDRVFRPQAEADRRAEQRPARQRSALEGVPRRPQDERPERHHADVVVELERPIGRVGRAEARQQSDEARRPSIDATDEQRDQRERAATEGERDRKQDEIAPRPGRRGDAAEPRRQRRVAQIGEPPFRAVDHPFGDVGVDRPFEQRAQRRPGADLHDDQRGRRPTRGGADSLR